MKSPILILAFLLYMLPLFSQGEHMTLWSQYNPPNMAVFSGLKYNDVWGYTSPSNTEYALIGSTDSVIIVRINSCSSIERVTAYSGGNRVIWRDMKTYNNVAYAVCDGCSEGLKIVDMSDIDQGNIVVTTKSSEFTSAHNIFVDQAAGRLYACGTNAGGVTDLFVYDVQSDPKNPTLLKAINFNSITGSSNSFYIHDLYVKNNIAYCSHGNTGLYVWDLNDLDNIPNTTTFFDTPGYSHSSWVDKSGTYIYSADENSNPAQPITVLQHNGTDLTYVRTISDPLDSPGLPIVHNPFVAGDYLYVSNYEDGLQVWDISSPNNPISIAHYDTYQDNNGNGYTGFEGNWGVYPFFASGCIVATDISYGAHFLSLDLSALPVTWESFDVQLDRDNQVHINWSVHSLYNHAYFEVLKSTDGINYKPIQKIETDANQPNTREYNAIDAHATLGKSYYKIKQVDLDGVYSYSDEKVINLNPSSNTINLFPNPIKDKITVHIEDQIDYTIQIKIYDMSGVLKLHKEIEPAPSLPSREIDISLPSSITSGNYLLSIYNEDIYLWNQQISIIR